MVEFALPKNSRVRAGKTFPAPEGAKNLRKFRVYRWNPEDDENWLKHTLAWCDEAGAVRFDYRPVQLQPLTNEIQSFPPKARVY